MTIENDPNLTPEQRLQQLEDAIEESREADVKARADAEAAAKAELGTEGKAPEGSKPTETEPPVVTDPTDYKQQFQTQQGILKATAQDKRNLLQMNADLQSKIDAFEDNVQAQRNDAEFAALQPITADDLLADLDIDDLSDEAVKAIKATNAKTADEINQLKSQLSQLKATVPNTQREVESIRQAAHDQSFSRYWNEVKTLVPDIDALVASPEFVAWQQQIDPKSGQSNYDLSIIADRSYNVAQCVELINDFRGVAKPEAGLAAQPAHSPVANLATNVVPGVGRAQPLPQASTVAQTYTEGEIAQAFNEYNTNPGQFSGAKYKARLDLLEDMRLAMAEGRVKG